MRGLIYLLFVTAMDRIYKFSKHLGTVLKVGFVVGMLSTAVYLAFDSMDPVTQATEKANKIIAQEKETTFRLCVRGANTPVDIQTCKDKYVQQYR